MSNPTDAYGNAANMAPIDPRENEATLLIKAASQLQRVREHWVEEQSELIDALTYNRKIWTVFAASAAEIQHPLPLEIKQNIANLALFIFKRTTEIEAVPAPEKLDSLININRQIAAGLFQKPVETAPAP